MSATTYFEFESDIKLLNKFECGNDVKSEPMFFNSDIDFAYKNGGEITKKFLSALPTEWINGEIVFDSRVHMLMPGWYPAIPGFHHDDIPRPEIPVGQHFISAGQPDYDNMRYKSEHIMALVNSEICPTLFILGKCKMNPVPENGLIYRQWDAEIKEQLKDQKIEVIECPDRQLIYFDWRCFHSGQKAKTNGWRWFGRVSRNTDRVKKITNEIRSQVQVYLEFPMEGW